MNNVNFTGTLQGIDSNRLKNLFQIRTAKTPNLILQYTKLDNNGNKDIFTLIKNHKSIISCNTPFDINNGDSIDKLVSIYNTLIAQNANKLIAKIKADKIKNDWYSKK